MNNSQSQRLLRVVHFFENLTPASLAEMPQIYAADAWFKDPFNEVRGLATITQIFSRMFVQVDTPRFIVTSKMMQDQSAFLTWDFQFRMKRFSTAEQSIHGATHLHFDAKGLVTYHRDYWDAAEELYEKMPLLGGLMRVLKRAAQH